MTAQRVSPIIYCLPAMRPADLSKTDWVGEHIRQVREMADFSYLAEPTGWLAGVLFDHAYTLEVSLRFHEQEGRSVE